MMARKGFGGRRGRPKKIKPAGELVQGTERQIKIDFTLEEKAEAFDEAGALWAQIQTHKAAAASENKARRLLEKKLSELHAQAAAGKRSVTVEVEEHPDFEAGVVTTRRADTGETVSEREMTDGERSAGVVLTGHGPVSRIGPQDATAALAEVAARVDAPEEETYDPLPSADIADVASVLAAVQQ